MSWQRIRSDVSFMLPLPTHVVVLFVATILSCWIAVVAWRRRRVPGAVFLAGSMTAAAVWTFAATVEAAVVPQSAKILWSQIEYVGLVNVPPLFLLTALRYANRWRLVTRARLIGLWSIPSITIVLVWTNSIHGLVWPGFAVGSARDNVLIYYHGIGFWIAFVYYYLLAVAVLWVLVDDLRRRQQPFRRQTTAMIAACVFPAGSGLLYGLGITPVPGLDISAIGCVATGLVFGWALLRYRLFDLIPIAREVLVERLAEGVVVLDPRGVVLDVNPAGERILGITREMVGRQLATLKESASPIRIGAIENVIAGLTPDLAVDADQRAIEITFPDGPQGERHFDVRVVQLTDASAFSGWLITLRDVTRQRQNELLLEALTHDLERQIQERTALLQETIDRLEVEVAERERAESMVHVAAIQERRRLARDLHDSVTQSLHSLALAADTASNRLKQKRYDRLDGSLESLANSARQAVKEMRLLLYELRLAPLEKINLVDALQTRLDAVEHRAGIDVEMAAPSIALWPADWEPDTYAIAMEALNNSLKHARANRVSVRIAGGPDWLELDVVDDGVGFCPDSRGRGGMGLTSMAERAERLGGLLTIDAKADAGTQIRLRVPNYLEEVRRDADE